MISRLIISCGVILNFGSAIRAAENASDSDRALVARDQQVAEFVAPPAAYLQGIALPKLDARLTPAVEGTVMTIHVDEGDQVTTGDPLLTIDNRVAQAAVVVAERAARATAAVRRAELAMHQAESILTRTELALRNSASSEYELAAKRNDYEQAEAAYQLELEAQAQADAELTLAKARLEQHTIRAPFDGEVLEIRAQVGDTIQPEDFAIRVADLRLLQVDMHLPMQWYASIPAGGRISLQVVAPIQQTVLCVARYVSPVIEPTSGTFRVSLEISNEQRELPAGLELWLTTDAVTNSDVFSPSSQQFLSQPTVK